MKKIVFTAITGLLTGVFSLSAQSKDKMEIVASFDNERPGNVAISPQGRVFITMSDPGVSQYAVKEILDDGSVVNFPTLDWIKKPSGNSIKGINATIGLQVSSDNVLWVLDIGNKKAEPAQPPKLIGWSIKTKKLVHVYPLPDAVLRASSFLQDFAIDEKHHTAIIADMSMAGLILPAVPAFVVIDLKTGYSQRLLENDPSFDPIDEDLIIDNKPISHVFSDGKVLKPRYPLNPISIDKEMKWLYYGALGGNKIYRIPTEALANFELSDSARNKKIEYYAPKPKSDGFQVGDKGQVYVSDLENNAIGMVTVKKYTLLVQDKELISWPDGIAIGKNGYLYFVSNQLQKRPFWNNGKEESKPPYYVLRIKIE